MKEYLSKLNNKLKSSKNQEKNQNIIIDSHLSHYLNSDYCFVVKTDLKTLKKRLQKRKYSEQKIKDNLEAEIFDICHEEAKELKRNVLIINN